MTEHKHTPGPWKAEISDIYFPSVIIGEFTGIRYGDGSGSDEVIKREHKLVVNVGPCGEDLARGVSSNRMESCQANAHLIAAAPEMLEALEAITARINGEYDNPTLIRMGDLTNVQDDIETYAKRAIAKAKGV